MHLLRALTFIFLIETSEGKLDEKESKKCVSLEERTTGKYLFPFEVVIPRAPRSVRKSMESISHKNLVGRNCKIRSCSECGIVFRGNKAFEEHAFSQHVGVNLVSCKECDKKFLKFESLYNHTRVWHKKRNKCKFCWKICSLETLKKHEETCTKSGNKKEINEIEGEWTLTTNRYRCEPCDRIFSSHASYRYHCRTSHRGEKIFPCRFCFKRFTTRDYLCLHLKKQHAVVILKAEEKPRKYSRGLTYSCPHCEMVVKGSMNYHQHGKMYHPGLSMFKCETCGEGFAWKNAVDRHAKEMHGEDKTCCRYCSKCYFRSDRMRVHEEACSRKKYVIEAKKVRAVNKEANKDRMGRHYCDICNKTMYVLDITFKRHMSTHEHFDYCDMCDDRFERKRYPDGLEKHMKLRHPLRENVDALVETARTSRVKFEKQEEIGKSEELTGWQWNVCSTASNVVWKSECDEYD